MMVSLRNHVTLGTGIVHWCQVFEEHPFFSQVRGFLFSKEIQLCCWSVFRRCGLVIYILISSGTQGDCVANGWSLGQEHDERLVDQPENHSVPSMFTYSNSWSDR